MLYGCGVVPSIYNRPNGRGIFLRMADSPLGPWTPPLLVFDPGNGYCSFMHRQDAACPVGSPNPADLGMRVGPNDPEHDAWGGEYDACLLPPRYNKYADGLLTLYWVMSTWNPYQVVLMKTDLRTPSWSQLLVKRKRYSP